MTIERKKLKKRGHRQLDETKFKGVTILALYNYLHDESQKLQAEWVDDIHFDLEVTVDVGCGCGWDDEFGGGDPEMELELECWRWETDEELEIRRKRSASAVVAAAKRAATRKVNDEAKELEQLKFLKAKYEINEIDEILSKYEERGDSA
jgi:hypothetical protein